jgi:single-stranded-DNA-specific exonuclease
MAAGLTIPHHGFDLFKQAFEAAAASLLTPADLDAVIETDGSLASHEVDWEVAVALDKQVWGQGFPAPLFSDEFIVKLQKVVGERHLKLSLQKADDQTGRMIDAIYFQQATFLPTKVHMVYELQTNEFNGRQNVQLNVRHYIPIESSTLSYTP